MSKGKRRQDVRGIVLFVVLGAVFVMALFSRQADISDLVFTNKELVEAVDSSVESTEGESNDTLEIRPEDNLCNALVALDVDQTQTDYEEEMRSVQQQLLVSDNPEHILTAALLEGDLQNQVRMVGRLFAATSNNVLVVWHSLQICSQLDAGTPACPIQTLERRLLSLDAINSEAWAKVAANRYSRGDQDGALDALRQAGSAASSSIHWVDTIEMVNRAFGVVPLTFAESVQYSFGIAGASVPTYQQTRMCYAKFATSDEWARACMDYAELLERQAETAMGAGFGRSMQQTMAKALNDEERLQQITERQGQEQPDAEGGITAAQGSWAMLVLSPAEFTTYLADLRNHGEERAQVLAEQRVPNFMKRTGLDQCAPWLAPAP